MLVLGQAFEDAVVSSFAERVPPGAVVVLNDTRVRHARLHATRAGSSGRVELFLLTPLGEERTRWRALGRANRPLRPGARLVLPIGHAEVEAKDADGTLTLRLEGLGEGEALEQALAGFGHVPLPPYVKRPDDVEDAARYQTVFSRVLGSVAAPTAGLHLTEAHLTRLAARGVTLAFVTLHVGLGTFRPVSTEDLDQHPMHAEWVEVPSATAQVVSQAVHDGRQVVAVGTTVVRALESAASPEGVAPFLGETRLLIQPGYRFRAVSSLLTNFHMPKSTLLALVSALAGRERLLAAYAHALARGYRFLSYGDAMWIPERLSDG